ncbi:MAG: glycosyltransferase family 4 protein [Ruminococcaceae bacterium]|nr:glycosyltransferase family 4 protein [Oscillospiraceae bacterium]
MNVLFVSISSLPHLSKHSISLDLLHEFRRNGHNVFVVCALERKENKETELSEEAGCKVLRVKIGNNKKANIIEKGLTTVMLPRLYIKAIKQYYSDVKFDLVMYPTPPVTHVKTVKYIKKRDSANSYLLLKDIFPQNAVDIGMMSKSGIKGILYKHFRKQEKELYAMSDRIGCMSQANVDYVLAHNPEVDPAKVEICPNSVEVVDMRITDGERAEIRAKYDIPLDKKVFVYGGNLGRPQGIPFLLECLKKQVNNSGAYFLIVGDGTEYGKLATWFDDAKPSNMKLMKRLPKEDYDKMVAACDVGMIFLDHRFTIPNFPSRLLSYMQAGLPVLACTDPNTDVGKVIVDGKFGWWCESNDAEAFSDKVEEALNADIEQMKENAFAYLGDHYTVEDAYRTICDK